MLEQSIATLLLLVVTVFVSYKGFTLAGFSDRYCFDVNKVQVNKEYIRFVSAGFLHTGWWHLILNMIVLLGFGTLLEPAIGSGKFLLLYFLSMIGSNLLALLFHRAHSDYTAVGASGAINGVLYATIALFPQMPIGLLFLPLSIPAWAFGLAYVVFTIFGIKAQWGTAGHVAHLGGALVGLLTAVAFYPETAAYNYIYILLIAVPTIVFVLFAIYKPQTLLVNSFSKKQKHYSIDHEYNFRKTQEQASIDDILEKIHRKGIKSLSKTEKETLERYAKMQR